MRVFEIGCRPGAACRQLCHHIGNGFILGIDHSAKAIALAENGSVAEFSAGMLAFRRMSVSLTYPRL